MWNKKKNGGACLSIHPLSMKPLNLYHRYSEEVCAHSHVCTNHTASFKDCVTTESVMASFHIFIQFNSVYSHSTSSQEKYISNHFKENVNRFNTSPVIIVFIICQFVKGCLAKESKAWHSTGKFTPMFNPTS